MDGACAPSLSLVDETRSMKTLRRLIACGSVDDGKSTLLGRLLHDTGQIPDDRLASMRLAASQDTHRPDIDLSRLGDGLQAEREQGITIDVAHLYFETHARHYILMDCPGHEQYTRNMVTGATNASLAIVLVDACGGIKPQTRRHLTLCALFGVRQVILAVNKMDIADHDERIYRDIADAFVEMARALGFDHVRSVPVVATRGDNIASRSKAMPWYDGPTLIDLLDHMPDPMPLATHFSMAVQWMNRNASGWRGYAGTVASGSLRAGDTVCILPGPEHATVREIIPARGHRDIATPGDPVTLLLDRDIDISRGNVIAAPASPVHVADRFAVHIAWFDGKPLLPHRSYQMRIGTRVVSMRVTAIRHKVDVSSGASLAASRLETHEIGRCDIETDEVIACEAFASVPALGGFVLIDRTSGATVGGGTILFALRRSSNIRWHDGLIGADDRATMKQQRPLCVWMTGLPGAGKSTLAGLVEQQLASTGRHTYVLDGDNLRHGLNGDLGFTEEHRIENVRRLAEVARLMVDAGLIVLVCAISPFAEDRAFARSRFGHGQFVEVFVDTPLDECERRDPKGLYKKARDGAIPNFTGIDAPYEVPASPDVHIRTLSGSAADIAASLASRIDGQATP